MQLIDDRIKYKRKDKSDGYKLIDGQNSTAISISKEKTWGINKKLTPLLNYYTVTDCFPRYAKVTFFSILL
tara:strand:- start:319 stop:531 length:213 start_codon:yes stop_codon:yes gene_type:complete